MSENPDVRGCVIPLSLHYNVTDHTWIMVGDDGLVTLGMTDIAQNLAGPLLHCKPKKPGSVRAKGRPIATVESSKWVGPVKTPISGEIVEINDVLTQDAATINRSPYKAGWIVKLRPSDLEEEMKLMVTGQEAVEAYRTKIEADDIQACDHVEGFEA